MKNINEASRLTVELAKSLIREMEAMGTRWNTAFLRAEFADGVDTYNGSFVLDDGVQLLDVLKHKPFFAFVREIVPQLRAASANGDAQFCVALLIVDSMFNYEVKYEYVDVNRWTISKLGGSTGAPAGYPASQSTPTLERKMVVVDYEPSGWFLVKDGERLLFDVNCSHSAVSYELLIELNESEHEGYTVHGHQFLSDLTERIQYSAPGALGSASSYRDRILRGPDRSQVNEATIAWLKDRNCTP